MKKFQNPTIEIDELAIEDVVATSSGNPNCRYESDLDN